MGSDCYTLGGKCPRLQSLGTKLGILMIKKIINNIVYGYSENGTYFRTRVRVRVQVRATLTVTFFLTSTVWDI